MALVSGGSDSVPESRSRENAGGLAFPVSWGQPQDRKAVQPQGGGSTRKAGTLMLLADLLEGLGWGWWLSVNKHR